MSGKSKKPLSGTLLFNRRGGGARLIGEKDHLLAWIDAGDTGQALHGDTVEAQPTRGDSARVTRVVERARGEIVGTFQRQRGIAFVVPDDPRLPCDILVRPGGPRLPQPPRVGEKVVAKLDAWKDVRTPPSGHLTEVLGAATDAGVDMLSVIRTYDLPGEFPPAAIREASAFSDRIPPAELAAREDCRGDFVLTIDPDDAKDHDDAVYVEKLRDGWRVSVHIADVAHFVRPGSALDREARRRGNSTYLADRCIPMLPLELSADLCSLREGVDRLAHTAFIEFSPEGKTRKVRFAKTVIRVAKRLTYREAKAILDAPKAKARGKLDGKIHEALHTAWDLASRLRKHRFEAGSLELDFPEVKIFLDEHGQVDRIERIANDESHQLIEEFMLAANEAVARELKNRAVPCIYRIHEKPDPDRLEEFRRSAIAQGLRVGTLTARKEVTRMLAALRGRTDEQRLKIEFLKSLRRAAYSVDPVGHYGLAKADYLHFTSPIRRYADLVAHRVLARERTGGRKELMEAAEHLSETERNSAAAEQDSKLVKKLEFFQRQVASQKPCEYAALVSDAKANGLVIEVTEVDTVGLVPVAALPGGPYYFDRQRGGFFSRRGNRGYKAGDKLTVRVVRVAAAEREIEFGII